MFTILLEIGTQNARKTGKLAENGGSAGKGDVCAMEQNKPVVEVVPNFSEGRDKETIERIAGCFLGRAGVTLLNAEADESYNRLVVTAAGEPEAVLDALVGAAGVAAERIDMRVQRGQHPRVGAADVLPFVPIANMTLDDAAALARRAGEAIWVRYGIPVYLYEAAALAPHRKKLEDIRRGEYEGMAQKIRLPEWAPDFGAPPMPEKTGVSIVGARNALIAYNIDLDTADIAIANAIARQVRTSGGGLPALKARGVCLLRTNTTQVTMNLVDYKTTGLFAATEAVRAAAAEKNVRVLGGEIVGLVPQDALLDAAASYLGLHDFSPDKVLERALSGVTRE